MKFPLESVLALFGLTIFEGWVGAAEPENPPEPIVIQVADIVPESDQIHIQTGEIQEAGHVKRIAYLNCRFKRRPKAEVEALIDDAVRNQRPVQIVDETNLIAGCRIVGPANQPKSEKEFLYRLRLRFDSDADAMRAAIVIMEGDLQTFMRRLIEDKRNWRI